MGNTHTATRCRIGISLSKDPCVLHTHSPFPSSSIATNSLSWSFLPSHHLVVLLTEYVVFLTNAIFPVYKLPLKMESHLMHSSWLASFTARCLWGSPELLVDLVHYSWCIPFIRSCLMIDRLVGYWWSRWRCWGPTTISPPVRTAAFFQSHPCRVSLWCPLRSGIAGSHAVPRTPSQVTHRLPSRLSDVLFTPTSAGTAPMAPQPGQHWTLTVRWSHVCPCGQCAMVLCCTLCWHFPGSHWD